MLIELDYALPLTVPMERVRKPWDVIANGSNVNVDEADAAAIPEVDGHAKRQYFEDRSSFRSLVLVGVVLKPPPAPLPVPVAGLVAQAYAEYHPNGVKPS